MDNVGIFYGQLEHFTANWYIYSHLVYIVVIWYICSFFGILYLETSGNPGLAHVEELSIPWRF
jgi:preprotein translocase subunit SecY